MAIYNMSFLDNSTNIVDIAIGLGNVLPDYSQYLIGNLVLFSFFIILTTWIATKERDFALAILVGSFITAMISILLYVVGMVAAVTISIPFILFSIALVFFFFFR